MNHAYLVDSVRTAVGKAPKGALRQMRPDDLGAEVVKGLLQRNPQIPLDQIDDVVMGCAFPEGEQGFNLGRVVAQRAGLPDSASELEGSDRLAEAMAISGFRGAIGSVVDVIAPGGGLDRLVLIGIGKAEDADEEAWLKVGGKLLAAGGKSSHITVFTDLDGGRTLDGETVAAIAGGAKLRAYEFDTYKTKKSPFDENGETDAVSKITFVSAIDGDAKKAWKGKKCK